jgi:hypothetical protein
VGVLFREVRPLFRCRRCGVKRRGCAAEVDIDSTGSRISSRLCDTKTQDVFCVKSELYSDIFNQFCGDLGFWARIWIQILPSSRKKSKKEVTFILFCNFFLSLKTDVNILSKSNTQKNLLFLGILKATEKKNRIRIRKKTTYYFLAP